MGVVTLFATRLPNGIVSDYTYGQLNRLEDLTQFRDADGDAIFDAGEDLVAQYDYDLLANGRRSGVTETDHNGATTGRPLGQRFAMPQPPIATPQLPFASSLSATYPAFFRLAGVI